MTLKDRYDNALTTSSEAARDAYVAGVDLFLTGNDGVEAAYRRAIDADEGFALAHAALARAYQVMGRGAEARETIAKAEAASKGASTREARHVAIMAQLIGGDGPGAYASGLEHLADFPRDVLIAQPATSVFGLIGFSGLPGREAEQLAYLNALAPHYGNDWWFQCQFAFAQVEVGQKDRAWKTIQAALDSNPNNAHGAHIRAHIHYERGEIDDGLSYLAEFRKNLGRGSVLHCHISWHVALWTLMVGNLDDAWHIVDADVSPQGAWGPPLNVLTDCAAFLHRAALSGAEPGAERWKKISDYAAKLFPNPGIAFADVHAALAHAMAGNSEALEKVIIDAKGPAADVVRASAEAFKAFAAQDWHQVIASLQPALNTHEQIGGSRAQRDLLEYTMLAALLRSGQADAAQLMMITRRPAQVAAHPVTGLH